MKISRQEDKKNVQQYLEEKITNKGPSFGKRHIQAILLFFCVTIEMMSRTSLSLIVVAMTDNTTSVNPDVPTYDWTNTNVILSSFYWGYMLPQIIVGQLGKTYGPKWLLFGAMGSNSIALAVVPFVAQTGGSTGVMICRIVQGICQGGLFPNCSTMLGRWAPENERARMSTFVYSGMGIGTVICLPLVGIISKSYLGWPASCYLFGGCGIIWCIFWLFFGCNSPAVHSSISTEEKKYIEVSLHQHEDEEVLPTPWKEILTSIQFWACLVSTVGSGFGIIFLQNEIPTYLEKVMKYDVSSSGFLTSLTASAGVVCGYIYGPLIDYIVEKKYVSQTNARRIFEIYSTYGCAATMLTLGYLDASQAHISIFILTLSAVFGAGILFGHGVNAIDLSPRFSGIILAIANSMSGLVALTAPLAVQFLVTDETNATQWRTVFIIGAVMYTVPGTFFSIFVSGERQWWDDGSAEEQKKALERFDKEKRQIKEMNEKA